ncbi:hypothetical protein GGI23_002518 [Coemansia sp. RSA 2559]|nr:hypothetical protein GGI23_002518 [Coemansia sp. RSA 2559]
MKFTISLLTALASSSVLALEATPSPDTTTVSLMPTAVVYKPIDEIIKRDNPVSSTIDLERMANYKILRIKPTATASPSE